MTATTALAHVQEQLGLLTGPNVPEPIATRVRRLAFLAKDYIDLAGDDAEQLVEISMGFIIERVGAYTRMPPEFATSRPLEDERTELRRLVDDLDQLSLHLGRAYGAATRHDQATVQAEAAAAAERFASDSQLGEVVPMLGDALDPDEVETQGLEVGDDGIPRMPVPEEPEPAEDHDPDHEGPDQ